MTRALILLCGLLLASCSLLPGARPAAPPSPDEVESVISVYDLGTRRVRTVAVLPGLYEAPNWTPDGRDLLINSAGALYRLPAAGGTPVKMDTGGLDRLNNDHGLTPDGRTLILSNNDGHIYTMPIDGGTPRRITERTPSYWHGVSPDGRTLAYVARRDEDQYEVYSVPTAGGPERRLTHNPGHEDGPDYSPDGRYLYFNADWEDGNFDIWRIPAEGGAPERITRDAYEDWFPHPSPDGRKIVLLSYAPGVEGHPRYHDVRLRLMNPDGSGLEDLVELFGGQGTINVPSWAPDSRAFAYVSYRRR